MALIPVDQMILSISMDRDWHLNKENEKQFVENTIGIHPKMSLYIYQVGVWSRLHSHPGRTGASSSEKPHSVTFEREIRNRDNLLETDPYDYKGVERF